MKTKTLAPASNPLLGGGVPAVLAAVAFGITVPLIQRFGRGVGPVPSATLLYAGVVLVSFDVSGKTGRREASVRAKHVPRLLAIALLAGGLAVLVLDLGRPDRLIVAMTYYNFKSIFAWNILLYTGFFAVVAVYLWMMMERRMNDYTKSVGLFAFVWRLILTTGTGSIFGFLIARAAYGTALLAPMFIIMSFAFGLALFILGSKRPAMPQADKTKPGNQP